MIFLQEFYEAKSKQGGVNMSFIITQHLRHFFFVLNFIPKIGNGPDPHPIVAKPIATNINRNSVFNFV